MRILRQVYLLLQKDLLLIWRSKAWFIVEMLVGLLLLPLIIIVVSRVHDEVSKPMIFDPVPITGSSLDIQQQVKNIARIYTAWCGLNQTLAYTGSNAHELMNNVAKKYQGIPSITLQYFESVELMRGVLMHDLNSTSQNVCGNYLGGILFDNVDVKNQEMKYRILFPRRIEKDWHLNEFWREDGPYSAIADLNNIPGDPQYWSSGFLSVQYAVEFEFLKLINKPIDFPVYLQRIPSPAYRNTGILAFLKQVPLMWSIIVLMSMVHTLKNILTEKESGIKTYMAVMGCDSVAFYGCHFIIGLLKVAIIILICAGTFSLGLSYVSKTLFLEFSLLYGMASIMFSVLFSTIFRKSSVALTIAIMTWILLMVIDSFYTTSLTNIPHCFLVSLNIFTAFKLGIKSALMAETTATHLGWTNMFTNSTHSFTFGLAVIMLIVDIILMILISLYLDAVCPTDDSPRRSPFFIFGYNSHKKTRFEVGQDEVDAPDENIEPDSTMNRDEADIDVRKMSKIWESTGQMAVDNLTFRAYRGQVTVLLGHNGAGKSSTFSAISGATSVSAGNVYICKEDIQSNLGECQRRLGFCPQYNPLFGRLTVREHLRLYARMKTMEQSNTLNSEIDMIAQQVQLKSKLNELAENLSGGMKRKLCVAMALIGDSRVILLDEPTAGMDPEARHDVKTLLEKTKKNRTILLTTHYINEADALGDKIAIMVKGRIVCNGSSEFLKNRFGSGYLLSIVVEEGDILCDSFGVVMSNILKITHKHTPEARIDKISMPEFSIILPSNQKAYFADLFEELESRKQELKISSFGLSFNTLEQVFLRVGELADPVDNQAMAEDVCENTAALFRIEPEHKGVRLYFDQTVAIITRHFFNMMRNKARNAVPIIASLLLFGLFVGIGRFNGTFGTKHLDLSLTKLEPLSIPITTSQASKNPPGFPYIVGQMNNMNQLSLSPLTNISTELMKLAAHQSPPLGIGACLMGNNTVLVLFNGAAYHAPPSSLLLLSNSMIKTKPDSIQLGVEIYDVEPTSSRTTSSPESNLVVSIIVILAFSSLVSTFAMPLVEDNQSRFKHQLLLTKLNSFIYWGSTIFWHSFVYTIFCALLTLVFLGIWMDERQNFILWAFYFWSSVPFIYIASFVFKSPVKAYAALLCWNVVVSLFALITDAVLLALASSLRDSFHYIAYIVLPSFSLGSGMVSIAVHSAVQELPIELLYDELSQVFWCMFFSGIIFWTILFLMESKKFSKLLHNVQCRIRKNPYQQIMNADVELVEDEDVLKERDALKLLGDDNFALAVRDAYKYYGSFCAVRNLTFGVKQSDCFGLLGVNGAGKTSTFNILSGETYANSGRVTVGGIDISDNPSIAYCPQFDALANDLTGREVLTLIGKLNGFQAVNERVKRVLESICLMNKANSLVRFYSGGQKRRLSIGVTLMSRASLILLDEPSAGIDPATRRKIWQLLIAVRQHNVAILLTSHSMDECEVLCNKIGFMNKGTLISIGSSQHLKSRYSKTYLLSFTLANPTQFSCRFLNSMVTREFDAPDTTDPSSMNTQHWDIPKTEQSWSSMFRRAQKIAEKYPHTSILPPGSELPLIKDFSLTQNSLEQVFLRLAEVSHESQT